MDGITDAPMRAFQGAQNTFTHSVTEFIRVSNHPLPTRVFIRDVPELATRAKTTTDLPVQIQILGGDPDRMAISALNAVAAGATAIDINFGCPAPTVNRNDGGASILRCPQRVYEITKAVREALPASIPVSVKARLGWDTIEPIYENAEQIQRAGASWLTIHARTKTQGYNPPVYWKPIGEIRRDASIPIVANGDIWTVEDFYLCQEQTRCSHYMIGRSALANPNLPHQIAQTLGLQTLTPIPPVDWPKLLQEFHDHSTNFHGPNHPKSLNRLKQWLAIAARFGDFPHFANLKKISDHQDFMTTLTTLCHFQTSSNPLKLVEISHH
ncbi:dihydrouridine synthase [bacterium]|nr:dihydrouridine synthase [bacterium]